MRRSVSKRLARLVRRAVHAVIFHARESILTELGPSVRTTQVLLRLRYRELAARGCPALDFRDVGFRVFSQNDEDGILLYLFACLGTVNRQAVEICAGNGFENNTANLIVYDDWEALLVDGDPENIQQARHFYTHLKDTFVEPPRIERAWVTAENVDELITRCGFAGEIDLLSLDLDGVDYWIWRAINGISPRVVVLEYQSAWGPERAVSVPYSPTFQRPDGESSYYGASLAAFVKLGREKGYRLVGGSRHGYNAFFLRDDIGADLFPAVPAEACFTRAAIKERVRRVRPTIERLPWVEV